MYGNRLVAAALIGAVMAALTFARAAEPIASVPYRVDYGGWFTVSVTVNGQGPYDFIIDTGATRSLVFENLSKVLDFPATGGPPLTVLGVSSGAEFPARRIGAIDIGGVSVKEFISVVLPNWSDTKRAPQGLVGLDILSEYIVVFDASVRLIHFYPSSADVKYPTKWGSVRLQSDDFGLGAGRLYTLDATVRRNRIKFILDFGAALPIINRNGFDALTDGETSISTSTSSSRIPGRVTDALDVDEKTFLFEADAVRAGRALWRNEFFVCHDADFFEQIGVQDKAFGLFGASLFINRSFALDLSRGELRIGPKFARASP